MYTLQQVVPWGRTLEEYQRMFSLSNADLRGRILGCADGPASFNADWTALGGSVVSCDPLYCFGGDEIQRRFEEVFDTMLDQARANAQEFVWDARIPTVQALGERRRKAMELFARDYEAGRAAGRYVDASLPNLPFDTGSFDLALCSHFLFLYSEQLSLEFHLQALRELCRVSRDVRVFPLLELGSVPSRHVEPAIEALRRDGFRVDVETTSYEFQRGGNQMLRIW
jgi:hypothetical protein